MTIASPPPAHPEPRSSDPAQKPIQDYVDAVNRADTEAIKHVLVPPDRLRKAVTCKPGPHDMISDLEHELAALDAQTSQLGGVHFELLKVRQLESRTVAVGDAIGNCTAAEPFETRTLSWSRRATTPHGTGDGSETSYVVALDGTWYMLPL